VGILAVLNIVITGTQPTSRTSVLLEITQFIFTELQMASLSTLLAKKLFEIVIIFSIKFMQLQGHIYSNSNLNSASPISTNTAQNNEQDKCKPSYNRCSN